MKKESNGGGNALGSWAFLIGLVLAVIVGAGFATSSTWSMILVAIGLIVGLLNITASETKSFLFSGVVLIIASSIGGSSMNSVPLIQNVLSASLAVFVPATVIVAIKNVFDLAKN